MFSYTFFLSNKFISKGKEHFLWFINLISVVGIALGVISLMLVLGVMNGFSRDLKRKIIGANPTITIEGHPFIINYQELLQLISKNIKEIEGISPYISSQVIYTSLYYRIGGVLKGIEPETEQNVTNISEFFKNGNLESLNDGIVLGSELAKELEVKVGDDIWVIGGIENPVQKKFKVSGIVECGVYSYDAVIGFTSIKNLQGLFRLNGFVHGLGMKTDNIYRSQDIAVKIKNLLFKANPENDYSVSTWIEKNKILFAALALEKKAMAVILILIVLIASFNIASTLTMTVFRKTKEIAILRAIGLSSNEIRKIFLYQGIILGGKGLLSGLFIGGILAYLLKRYQFIKLPEFIYDVSRLPIELSSTDLFFICIAVIGIVSLASIYPAKKASSLNPAEALKYE